MSNKIKCSHILVAKQSEALTILEKIKSGEKFANLAKEFSTDTGSGKKEGCKDCLSHRCVPNSCKCDCHK